MKQCVICKQDKELSNFYSDKSKKDRLSGRCKVCAKQYKEDNKEKIWENRKEYNKINEVPIKEYSNQYNKEHSEELKEIRIFQKPQKKEYDREYFRNRANNDPLFKLKNRIACRINESFRNMGYSKKTRTYQILGCEWVIFKDYIESKFEPWMKLENYGNPKDGILEFNKTWDLDHIIPISSAKTEEELIKLSHYTNLQPLCSKYNREIKRNII